MSATTDSRPRVHKKFSTNEKSLYFVAKEALEREGLKTYMEMVSFKNKLQAEVEDITSQIAMALAQGSRKTPQGLIVRGSDGYTSWLRRAESSKAIKKAKINIIEEWLIPVNVRKEGDLNLRVRELERALESFRNNIEDALGSFNESEEDPIVEAACRKIEEALEELEDREVIPERADPEAE